MRECFDHTHWSRQLAAADPLHKVIDNINSNKDVVFALSTVNQWGPGIQATIFAADIENLRARLISFVESFNTMNLSNTVTATRYLDAVSALLRITDPTTENYPVIMNLAFKRLRRDGMVSDYNDLIDMIIDPMLNEYATYHRLYGELRSHVVTIGPGHEAWDYIATRNKVD
jgi:hypothetical protein